MSSCSVFFSDLPLIFAEIEKAIMQVAIISSLLARPSEIMLSRKVSISKVAAQPDPK